MERDFDDEIRAVVALNEVTRQMMTKTITIASKLKTKSRPAVHAGKYQQVILERNARQAVLDCDQTYHHSSRSSVCRRMPKEVS